MHDVCKHPQHPNEADNHEEVPRDGLANQFPQPLPSLPLGFRFLRLRLIPVRFPMAQLSVSVRVDLRGEESTCLGTYVMKNVIKNVFTAITDERF